MSTTRAISSLKPKKKVAPLSIKFYAQISPLKAATPKAKSQDNLQKSKRSLEDNHLLGETTKFLEPLKSNAPSYFIVLKKHPLQFFEDGQEQELSKIEQEYENLCVLAHDEKLSEEEKLAIEQYRLALMKSVETSIRGRLRTPPQKEEPPVKPSFWRQLPKRIGFWGLFLGGTFPELWGNYVGLAPFLIDVLSFSNLTAFLTSFTVQMIELILSYSTTSPQLKAAMGIPITEEPSQLEVFSEQLKTLNAIDFMMHHDNDMTAEEYQAYFKLIKGFNNHIEALQEHNIYLLDTLPKDAEAIKKANIRGKSILITKDFNKAQFIHNNELIETVKIQSDLSVIDRDRLKKSCKLNGKVELSADNKSLIEKLREEIFAKTKSQAVKEKGALKEFEETWSKWALRWALVIISAGANLAGTYFFAISLMASIAATAALLGTPLGWGLVGGMIIFQMGLQYVIRDEFMFNLLNPSASRHNKIKDQINKYEPNEKTYEDILEKKQAKEELEEFKAIGFRQQLQKNPHVDSNPYSLNPYPKLGLFDDSASSPAPTVYEAKGEDIALKGQKLKTL
jgi:hypothetical protein